MATSNKHEETTEKLRYPTGRYEKRETYTAEELKGWIGVLKALPSWMDACIENLDEHQLQIPYREGGWTIQQVVHHVADSHVNAYIRLKLALTEDTPTIKPYNEAAWALLPDVQALPVNISVTMLHTLHIRMVAIMTALTPDEWERTFYHPEHGRYIPLWEMAAMYAWHSRHHTEHIRQLRERMNW